MDHCVCAGGHGFGGFAGFVGVADEYGVGGASCFDVGHGVAYERRGCWGDQVRVRSCAAGVGWAVVMASTSWAVKAALTYLGRASSAVASCRAGTHWPGAGGWACSSSASCERVGSGCSATTEVRTLTGATGYQVGCSSGSVPDREVRVIPALVAVRLRDRPCAPARGDRAARVGVDGQGYRSHLSERRASPASA